MKNVFLAMVAGILLLACTKTEFQQTRDTVRSADNLLRSANEGLKSIDSISAIVKDSARFHRVIVPEIEKTKNSVEKTIRENAHNLDSINKEIDKVKDRINRSTEVLRAADSATKELQKDGSIFDKIGTITGTISKISKSQKQDKTETSPSQNPVPENDGTPDAIVIQRDPLTKNASFEIEVNDLKTSREKLASDLRNNGGDIVTENFSDAEGTQRQYITAKVPLKNFDTFAANIANSYGNIISKSIESEGTDFNPNQMCDVSITFRQEGNFSGTNGAPDKTDTFGNRSSEAFKKGISGFGDVMVLLLPFWPLLLITALIWYFISRNKKKRRDEEHRRQLELAERRSEIQKPENPKTEEQKTEPQQPNSDDDYSRFMPKN